jgi:cytochrome c-type biogenesis protein CcmH/NrfG
MAVALPLRLMIAVPLSAALAWLAVDSVRRGDAGTVVYEAAAVIAAAPPDAPALASVAGHLERAQAVTPDDPEIEELLGELALRRIDRADSRDRALAHFSRAIALRPTSPYTWAAIADARYRKGDTGPAFETALRHASELGPAEPEVQRTVVDLGLATWD